MMMQDRMGVFKIAIAKYKNWLTDDNLTLLSGWARRGLTDEQIAHNIGIAPQTLSEWKKNIVILPPP